LRSILNVRKTVFSPSKQVFMVFDTGFAQTPLYDVAPPAASRLKYV
jgi:hypothetical protein